MERRGLDAAQVTVAPVDTAQYRSPRSPSSEMSSDVRVCMEKNEGGIVDPERDQLEPPLASTGFETPGQQCHPIWETGRTTADGCLAAGVGSIWGETRLPNGTRHRDANRYSYDTGKFIKNRFLGGEQQTRRQGERQRRKQAISPRWERREAIALESGCNGFILFSGGNLGPWVARCVCLVFCFVRLVLFCFLLPGDHFFTELKYGRKREESQ